MQTGYKYKTLKQAKEKCKKLLLDPYITETLIINKGIEIWSERK